MRLIYKINYKKYLLRTLLIRPINIILLPGLLLIYFTLWLSTSDENWLLGEKYLGSRLSPEKDDFKIWWDLKKGCIRKCMVQDRQKVKP